MNHFGLRIAGLTAVMLLALFGLYTGGRWLIGGLDNNKEQRESLSLAKARQDTDGDGVADYYETTFYKTDPAKADTDGDGMDDLKEITSGRDPLVPAPNDASKPATGEQVAGVKDSYTKKYLASLPEDVAREDILNQVKLEEFVAANRGELLPVIPRDIILTSEAAGAEAVKTYLDNISAAHNNQLEAVSSTDLEGAFRVQVNTGSDELVRELARVLNNNLDVLFKVAAPVEVVPLHTKMIAATTALRDNAALLQRVNDDFAGALVGAKNIEELGGVFQEIARDVAAWEEKYDLE